MSHVPTYVSSRRRCSNRERAVWQLAIGDGMVTSPRSPHRTSSAQATGPDRCDPEIDRELEWLVPDPVDQHPGGEVGREGRRQPVRVNGEVRYEVEGLTDGQIPLPRRH